MRKNASIALSIAASLHLARVSYGQRALGIDVSDWQGTLTLSNWQYIHNNSGKGFAFLRSSRGGTTGFYDEHDAPNNNGLNTLSQRYDDTKFYDNIKNATSAGIWSGPYHFGRADIVASTLNSGGIPNNGADEANHMLQQAGMYMRPGYLLPVFDLEAGASQRTADALAQFVIDFGQTIYNAKGVWPIVYSSSSYASDPATSGNGSSGMSGEIRPVVAQKMPNLWIARWPSPPPTDAQVQTMEPPAATNPPYPNVYGVWNPSYPTIPNPQPWKFWQYSSSLYVPISSTGSLNIDTDVAHGDIDYVKDFLVPAMWKVDSDGQWTTLANWNCGVDESSWVDNAGTFHTDSALAARLPGPYDNVRIDRPAGDFLITLASGSQSIRNLITSEQLTISGGSLTIQQYAQINNTLSLAGGYLGAASVTIANGVVATKANGTFTTPSLINNGSYSQSAGTANFGAITGGGSMNIQAGLFTADTIKQASLTSTGGTLKINAATGGTSVVNTLSITSTAKLDLVSKAIIVNYSVQSPIASIKSQLTSGYANGAWTGTGVNSSTAAATVGSAHATALGYAEASDLFTMFPAMFKGESIDSTSILICYTAYGDATLNGSVDSTDFNTLVANFGGAGKRWSQGDFNYDGSVSTIDFNLLAANFSFAVPGDVASSALIPEPGVLAPLGIAIFAAVSCRVRRAR